MSLEQNNSEKMPENKPPHATAHDAPKSEIKRTTMLSRKPSILIRGLRSNVISADYLEIQPLAIICLMLFGILCWTFSNSR